LELRVPMTQTDFRSRRIVYMSVIGLLCFWISVGIISLVVSTQYLQVELKAAIAWRKSAVDVCDFLLLNIQYGFRSADVGFVS
jgi:hypothetical protein